MVDSFNEFDPAGFALTRDKFFLSVFTSWAQLVVFNQDSVTAHSQ